MNRADAMRRNAENCFELAEQAASRPEQCRFMRMGQAWLDLAEHQEWLDGATASHPWQPERVAA